MHNLFAIPFDHFKVKNSQNGTIFNIVDSDMILYAQVEVANIKSKRHDLCIMEQQDCHDDTRLLLSIHLDKLLGTNNWKVITVFNKKEAREKALISKVNDTHDDAKSIMYDDGKSVLGRISLNRVIGLV